jgi:drug/metabolite transporter (DMT)-like permease
VRHDSTPKPSYDHGFFSGQRSLITAGIGVLAYLLGGILERRAHPGSSQSWADMLGVGIVAAVGLGFFTGGLQHFPDSPARSACVVERPLFKVYAHAPVEGFKVNVP